MVMDSRFKYLQSTKFLVPIKNIILIFIGPLLFPVKYCLQLIPIASTLEVHPPFAFMCVLVHKTLIRVHLCQLVDTSYIFVHSLSHTYNSLLVPWKNIASSAARSVSSVPIFITSDLLQKLLY